MLGLIACIIILAWRVVRLPRSSYLRQQLVILLVFIAAGVLPSVLLTIYRRAGGAGEGDFTVWDAGAGVDGSLAHY